MPDTYVPQNVLHEELEFSRGNETRFWDETPNANGDVPPPPYVKTQLKKIADNAKHAEEAAVSLQTAIDAFYAVPIEISPREFSYFETDGVPDLTWLHYDGITFGNGEDYISDESEDADQVRTGYATWKASPGFAGHTAWSISYYRAAGATVNNVLEVFLYERVTAWISETASEKRWVERGHITSAAANVAEEYAVGFTNGDGLDEANDGTSWLIVFKLTNCPDAVVKFGGVTLVTRNKTLPQGSVLP